MLDFGFGFWILFFFVFFGCGKMCGWGAKKYRNRERDMAVKGDEDDRLSRLEERVRERHERAKLRPTPVTMSRGQGREPETRRPAKPQKTPLQDLQQRFIEGRLTLSEYERELDRLERID